MSRGWESKDVESQQAERESRGKKEAPLSERERKIASLELSLKAAWRDLGAARHTRHRAMLTAAIAHLEAEVAKLRE
jgi:hypothetical protein